MRIVLASKSEIRRALLTNADVSFTSLSVSIDEENLRLGYLAQGLSPRDIADALAEQKALKGSAKEPGAAVLGCDQVLDIDGAILSKPESKSEALDHIRHLSGRTHYLYSAAVAVQDGQPLWRHIGQASLRMRNLDKDWTVAYVERNWDSIRHSVGGYKIEEEGVKLMESISGDHFTIQGFPLLQFLSWLNQRGELM